MNLEKNQGQSLVEIVIALAIVGLVLIGLVRTVTLSLKNMEFSTNKNLALNLAQAKMEEIRNQRDSLNWEKFWSDWSFQREGSTNLLPICFTRDGQPIGCSVEGKVFTLSGVLADKSTGPVPTPPNKVEIIIRVSWEEGERTHYATISGYLTKWN